VRHRFAPLVCLALVVACASVESGSFPTPDREYAGFSPAEAATLLSLEQIDGHPLYTMNQYAGYDYENYEGPSAAGEDISPNRDRDAWACSLFAALADPESRLFGRNFDWDYSPSLLLFSDPPDGYASAALVDIAYLGFDGSADLTDKPLDEVANLLDAHHIPFDGMNEAGLIIGMAAVAPGNVPVDPAKPTIGSLGVIRLMLDQASTVGEAIDLMAGVNIDFVGGPPLHYLMADRNGDSAVVEFYQGETYVFRGDAGWNLATNFLLAGVEAPAGQSRRYDTVWSQLESTGGVLDSEGAMSLLQSVARSDTQWSVVYSSTSGQIRVVMDRNYDRVYEFMLEPAG